MLNTHTTNPKEQVAVIAQNANLHIDKLNAKNVFDGKPFDGVYFKSGKSHIDGRDAYTFDFIQFNEPQLLDHNEDLGSDRWLMLLFEKASDDGGIEVVFFQAYLGDVLYYAKNQAKAGSQGLVIKKSQAGFKIILKILQLYPTLVDMIETAKEEYAHFVLNHPDLKRL